MAVFDSFLANLDNRSANHLLLIDPDSKNEDRWEAMVDAGNDPGFDAFLVGGSLIMDDGFDRRVAAIKEKADAPIVLFPGASSQLSRHADAILFLTLLSGRNPQYLIGEQVQAAPVVKHMGLESIPTGYLLMDGGSPTAVQFVSGTQPLPMDKPDIVVAHALAAQYMGMSVIYLEAGSGASKSVPDEIISAVTAQIEIPVIVGGGIREPAKAIKKVKAGAKFIVTGTIAEQDNPSGTMKAFADAIHGA